MSILSDARKYRAVIEQAAQSLDDATAMTAIALHPAWAAGTEYTKAAGRPVGYKVQRNGKLWKLVLEHTSQTGWEPENAATLWTQIDETHAGTLDDPIPYEGNMALENGKYYIQNGVIYLCTRDTENPVYNALADLAGIYVEVVS